MVGNIVDVGWATIKSGCLPITALPPPVCKLSLFLSSCVSHVELSDGRGRVRGVGEEPNYDRGNAWSSTNYSILSAFSQKRNK